MKTITLVHSGSRREKLYKYMVIFHENIFREYGLFQWYFAAFIILVINAGIYLEVVFQAFSQLSETFLPE